MEAVPESERTYPGLSRTQERTVRHSRGFYKKLLVPTMGVVVGVVAFGSETKGAFQDRDREGLEAAVAQIKAQSHPEPLLNAQKQAAREVFKHDDEARNIACAERAANNSNDGVFLDVGSYVDPKNVKVSEDGRFFTVDGMSYRLDRSKTDEGDVVVSAGRVVEEQKLLRKNKLHFVNPILVGGGRNDLSSDLNKDGIVTEEEKIEVATQSARTVLHQVFQHQNRVATIQR